VRLRLQFLEQALAEHLQRATTGFRGTCPAHAELLSAICALTAASPHRDELAEGAARAAMRVLSGGLPPQQAEEITLRVRQAAEEGDAMAGLMSGLS
jgi:hypothetical protein